MMINNDADQRQCGGVKEQHISKLVMASTDSRRIISAASQCSIGAENKTVMNPIRNTANTASSPWTVAM